jgi:hypothetical protein
MSREHTEFEDALQVRPDDFAGAPSSAQGGQIIRDFEDDGSSSLEPQSSINQPNGSAWTIPLICLGIGMIAMCMIIPAADENRRLMWEQQKLSTDLAHVQKQIAINNEFLARLASDPGLSERLAQRQMNMVREGTTVLELPGRASIAEMSPFDLVTLPPPPALAEYRPIGGKISRLFHNPKSRLYLLGAGMIIMVLGVILGSQKSPGQSAPAD